MRENGIEKKDQGNNNWIFEWKRLVIDSRNLENIKYEKYQVMKIRGKENLGLGQGKEDTF